MTDAARIRILHYLEHVRLELGGVVRAVLDLAGAQAAAGHHVTLATTDDRDAPELWKQRKSSNASSTPSNLPTVVRVQPPDLPLGRFSKHRLAQFDPLFARINALHLHGMWEPTTPQLAGYANARGLPYLQSIHGMLDDWCMAQRSLKKRLFLSLAGRKTLERAAAVHTTAQAELEQARKWFPRGRGIVIPLVMDLDQFHSLPGPQSAQEALPAVRETMDRHPQRLRVLFLSRVNYKKRVEIVIEATALLRDRGVDITTFIAGTGEEEYGRAMREVAQRLKMTDRVHFLGFVSGPPKISLYELSDVFVLPTSQENFGFVLFEALAAGTPVLTTRAADTWPELEASGGAMILEPDAGAFADALQGLAADEARRRAMGAAGRAWVLEHLRAEAIVEQFAQVVRDAGRS